MILRTKLLTVLIFKLLRRSEEHTSELQSRQYLVCRLLLEKKKKAASRWAARADPSAWARSPAPSLVGGSWCGRAGSGAPRTHQHLLRSQGSFFFFNDPAPTEIYPLSLHDPLPISSRIAAHARPTRLFSSRLTKMIVNMIARSEEHTSELQSRSDLVCRLLLEK